jgi:hypothetical protein
VTDDILILVGAKPSALSHNDVTWLIDRLRQTYPDPTTEEANAALQLAWALELTIENPEEQLELGLPQVEPVLQAIEGAPLSPALLFLQHGLRRLGGESGK